MTDAERKRAAQKVTTLYGHQSVGDMDALVNLGWMPPSEALAAKKALPAVREIAQSQDLVHDDRLKAALEGR